MQIYFTLPRFILHTTGWLYLDNEVIWWPINAGTHILHSTGIFWYDLSTPLHSTPSLHVHNDSEGNFYLAGSNIDIEEATGSGEFNVIGCFKI